VPRLTPLAARLPVFDLTSAKPAPKTTNPFYLTPEWRDVVALVRQSRPPCCAQCRRTGVRLFADHIIELQDGGDPYDTTGIQLLCSACHSRKTVAARARRMGARI
jgi:5-methylcytosine-specific restriction endonuclease McrA